MTTNPSAEPLQIALKQLWGAACWPGQPDSKVVITHPAWSEAMRGLDQLGRVRSSGVVHGVHGTGKSYLLHRWSQQLASKHYRIVRLAHSSLMGSDLLRQLVRLGGKRPLYRRGDNVLLLSELWQEWAPAWPILIIEEAQDLNVAALEELRLLACARADAKPPFSLILCGDEDLLPRLDLGINRALVSRLGFCLKLPPWSLQDLGEYLHARLAEAGIHASPLEPAAETLLLQCAQGVPRTVNALLLGCFEHAAIAASRAITTEHVRRALDAMPWLARGGPP